jgi:hypothetical protein
MNKLEDFKGVFAGVQPWAGVVPKGYAVDFLGICSRWRPSLGYRRGDLPVAERQSDRILSLPIHRFLSIDDQSYARRIFIDH